MVLIQNVRRVSHLPAQKLSACVWINGRETDLSVPDTLKALAKIKRIEIFRYTKKKKKLWSFVDFEMFFVLLICSFAHGIRKALALSQTWTCRTGLASRSWARWSELAGALWSVATWTRGTYIQADHLHNHCTRIITHQYRIAARRCDMDCISRDMPAQILVSVTHVQGFRSERVRLHFNVG